MVSCQLPNTLPRGGSNSHKTNAAVAPALVAKPHPMAHMSESDQRKPRLETANAVETLILLVGEGESAEKTATRVIPRRTWDIDRVAAGIETEVTQWTGHLISRQQGAHATWMFDS